MEIASSAMAGKDAGALGPLQWIKIFRSAASDLSAQVSLHAQLAQVEWAEEKQRLYKMAVVGVLGFIFCLCFLLCISALVVVLSWNTPFRIHAMLGVSLVHLGGLVWAGVCLKKLVALSSKRFAATRAELASDLALLKSAL